MTEIKEIQNRAVEAVNARLKRKVIEKDEDILMIHLMEEFGELAQQIMNKKLKRRDMNLDNIKDEISDCIILLMNLADNFNIDLEKALENKIEELNNSIYLHNK